MQTTTHLPTHFDPAKVGEVWRVPYQERAIAAQEWAKQHRIQPATSDSQRVCLLAIDVQNTFCIPEHELFVGGRSGRGAVDDNVRLCEFIYRNLAEITEIALTMDTHTATQIFHPVFWVNSAGAHPSPMTVITLEDVENGTWNVNPAAVPSIILGKDSDGHLNGYQDLQTYGLHYVRRLHQNGKFPLTIWPYHSILGGIGHAIVSAVEEACFFHTLARGSQTHFELKGSNPLTENYSVLQPEVMSDQQERAIAHKNTAFLQKLLSFDRIIIAGQAKSHCVAWTIDDLLSEIQATDPSLAQKVYLLEDCMSPVVVPGIVDFTDQAIATFQRFAHAGMQVIRSTDW
ncbi:MAG: isochorismatase [Timaviella obliquedivisa GSE-PSE-MK23-08B]|jgi:nicotinamidase-related amidase|nr:isochorismatase [Timaviella obliquedivisa GSE-PSE-MK23-08B]